jgi:NADPH2:quinone reductase
MLPLTSPDLTSDDPYNGNAGTGGVGHVAIQIARAKGADVFATVSGDNKAIIAKTLGATPINYKTTSVAEYVNQHTGGSGFDVVFDTIGGDNIPRCWDAVNQRIGSFTSRLDHATDCRHG